MHNFGPVGMVPQSGGMPKRGGCFVWFPTSEGQSVDLIAPLGSRFVQAAHSGKSGSREGPFPTAQGSMDQVQTLPMYTRHIKEGVCCLTGFESLLRTRVSLQRWFDERHVLASWSFDSGLFFLTK